VKEVESTRFARTAGAVAIVAGALVLLNRIATFFMIPDNLPELRQVVVTPAHAVYSISQVVAFALLAVALLVLYQVQAAGTGRLAGIGVTAAIIGTVFLAGDWWYEAFAVPWLADVAPVVFETGAGGRLLGGGLASFVLFALGWATFGAATVKAHVLPRSLAVGTCLEASRPASRSRVPTSTATQFLLLRSSRQGPG